MFFTLTFLFSILANCVHDESRTEKSAPISPKSLKFVGQTDFFVLLTGKFRRGVTERVLLKRIFTSGEYTVIQRLCIA